MLDNCSEFNPSDNAIQYSGGYIREIEKKLAQLEEENKNLQSQAENSTELDNLKLELKHANSLKDIYEEKYNEAIEKLMYMENDDSLIYEENEQINNLNKKVDMLVKANEDLKKEVNSYIQKAEEEEKEKNYYKFEVVPKLEKRIRELEERNDWSHEKEKLEEKIRSLEESKEQLEQELVNLKQNYYKNTSNRSSSPEIPFIYINTEQIKDENSPYETPESPKIKMKKRASNQNITRKSAPFQIQTQTLTPPRYTQNSNKSSATPTFSTAITPQRRQSPLSARVKQKSQYFPSFLRKKRIVRSDKRSKLNQRGVKKQEISDEDPEDEKND